MSTVKPWVAANLDRSGLLFYIARGVKAAAETIVSLVATWPWPVLLSVVTALSGEIILDMSMAPGVSISGNVTWLVVYLLAVVYFGHKEYDEAVRCTYGTD